MCLHSHDVIPDDHLKTFSSNRKLTFASSLVQDKWILNMNKYYQKLLKLIKLKRPSPSENGASMFTIMTTAIFDRIKALRAHGSKN